MGEHARQAGSSVTPDRIRFDFTHNKPLTKNQLTQLTEQVNMIIMQNHHIHIDHSGYDEAITRGATALFGEKYGDIVRTVQIGDDENTYSIELCGGTHVQQTGELGLFIVTSESSISSNTRRIEAITGNTALKHVDNSLKILHNTAKTLQSEINEIPNKIKQFQTDYSEVLSNSKTLEIKLIQHQLDKKLDTTTLIDNIPVLITDVITTDTKLLRNITDWYIERNPNGIIILAATTNSNVHIIVRVSNSLTSRGINAGDIVSTISHIVDGKGGGNPTLGQGGGNNPHKLNEALLEASEIIKRTLSEYI